MVDCILDVFGLFCLMFLFKIKLELNGMVFGEELEVIVIDFGLVCDIFVFIELFSY